MATIIQCDSSIESRATTLVFIYMSRGASLGQAIEGLENKPLLKAVNRIWRCVERKRKEGGR
jgi:hypothetical protein